jgi:hypothetical protein
VHLFVLSVTRCHGIMEMWCNAERKNYAIFESLVAKSVLNFSWNHVAHHRIWSIVENFSEICHFDLVTLFDLIKTKTISFATRSSLELLLSRCNWIWAEYQIRDEKAYLYLLLYNVISFIFHKKRQIFVTIS